MYCSHCGARLVPNAAFCSSCGTLLATGAGGPLQRPAIVTVLAVLQFIGAAMWLVAGLVAFGALATDSGQVAALLGGLVLGGLGATQLACGIGLWTLKPYGRTLQLVFAWIGLIGIPFGTIISILVLVYFFKPGIKALFSGKPAADLTADELAQIAAASKSSWILIVVVVVLLALAAVAVVGIIAAIAVPGLTRARATGNEVSAIASLRAINSGEASYSASCAAGGYAVTLEDLARPPTGSRAGFISPDLGINGVARSGYRVTLEIDRAAGVTNTGAAATTCNGSTSPPASSYFASAEPVTQGGGTRYFATDARGTIFSSTTRIANPIVSSATVVPVQ